MLLDCWDMKIIHVLSFHEMKKGLQYNLQNNNVLKKIFSLLVNAFLTHPKIYKNYLWTPD